MFRCDRLALPLCAAALSLVGLGSASQPARYQGSRVSMACTYAIDAYGPDADPDEAALLTALTRGRPSVTPPQES